MITFDKPNDVLTAMRAKTIPFIVGKDYLKTLYEILEDTEVEDPIAEEGLLPEREEVYQYFQRVIAAVFEEFGDNATFSYLFGGELKVCETEDDLKQVEGCDMKWAKEHNNQWPNVMDMPMSWDHAGFLDSDEKTGWFIFLLCSNNAGGDVFYVPEALWEKARVREHLEYHRSMG